MPQAKTVTVRLYGGSTASRRVISVGPKHVVVCSDEEYVRAMEEGREPMTLAFPMADVVDWGGAHEETPKKGPQRTHGNTSPRASVAGD